MTAECTETSRTRRNANRRSKRIKNDFPGLPRYVPVCSGGSPANQRISSHTVVDNCFASLNRRVWKGEPISVVPLLGHGVDLDVRNSNLAFPGPTRPGNVN